MATTTELKMSLAEKKQLQQWLLQWGVLNVDGQIGPETRKVIKVVQQLAVTKGYYAGKVDGEIGEMTRAAFAHMGFAPWVGHKTPITSDGFDYPLNGSYMGGPLKALTQAQKTKLFGGAPLDEKGVVISAWQIANIQNVRIPQLKNVPGANGGLLSWNAKRADKLVELFNALEQEKLLNRILSCAGTYDPRFVRGSTTTFSSHAYGTAIDLNAPQNWLGQEPAMPGKVGCLYEVVEVAKDLGWYWGGWFTRRDGMHFELTG